MYVKTFPVFVQLQSEIKMNLHVYNDLWVLKALSVEDCDKKTDLKDVNLLCMKNSIANLDEAHRE